MTGCLVREGALPRVNLQPGAIQCMCLCYVVAVMFSLNHMDFVQVSPCNERAVLDQLASYFQRRLAGYQSSNTAEVSSISILNCLICNVDQARVITSPNYPASGQ